VRDAGVQIAVASSAKKDEVDKYLDIACITDLADLKTASDDVEESKPAPDIFAIVLKKVKIKGADAVAIGDTPYDVEAAGKAKIATIGVLCGGFRESSLRQAGCERYIPDQSRCSLASRTPCCEVDNTADRTAAVSGRCGEAPQKRRYTAILPPCLCPA
jgi:phosphoglycolate phosphatase-like HAD superfamily hydrolase